MKGGSLKARYEKSIDTIKTSFWFVPFVCVVFSCMALYLTHVVDHSRILESVFGFKFFYSISAEGARSLLSTSAASVITITSIAFSMTIVTLTLTSNQFGPRLLRGFMQDKNTQLSLGIFVSTFVFNLLLIRSTSSDQGTVFIPGLGVALALLLTLMSILTLVYLIHHVAISIQAESIVDKCWQGLKVDIERIFKKHNSNIPNINLSKHKSQTSLEIKSTKDGYVQVLDYENLVNELQQAKLFLSLSIKPGDYIKTKQGIGHLYRTDNKTACDDMNEKIMDFCIVGKTRTPIQDPEFAINQLVEIAVRALSPGINDPFTAILCVHRLGSIINDISSRQFPPTLLFDGDDALRIERKVTNIEGIVASACDQIRQNCDDHPSVIIAFLDMLESVAQISTNANCNAALFEQGKCLVESLSEHALHRTDMLDIQQRFEILKKRVSSISLP